MGHPLIRSLTSGSKSGTGIIDCWCPFDSDVAARACELRNKDTRNIWRMLDRGRTMAN
jgi:hypothetical protein